MGQPVTLIKTSSPRPGIVRFELNRSLTGMGHVRYEHGDAIVADEDRTAIDQFQREGGLAAARGSCDQHAAAPDRYAGDVGDRLRHGVNA